MEKKKSKKKAIIVIILAILVIASIVATWILLPRTGTRKVEIWSPDSTLTAQNIEKKSGEDFKILQLTDTQLWTKSDDNKATLEIIKKTIKEVKPDFVIHTGDNVSGLLSDLLLKDLIKTMDETGVPWASVYGNHDGEGRADLNWQDEKYMNSPKCMYMPGPSNISGNGNYVINVTENGKAIQSMIFMDSHAKRAYDNDESGYDYINYDQIMWYEWVINQSTKQNDGKVLPSMLFFHIPLPEFETALAPHMKADEYTLIPENEGFGMMGEKVSAPKINSGLFNKVKELGSTKEIFVGHDHSNSATITYEGVRLSYGVKTGPSPEPWNDAVEYGGKLITIKDGTNAIELENIIVEKVER